MKRMILFILLFCMSIGVFSSTVFGENTADISAEDLYQNGKEAFDERNYEKAMEFFLSAAELGNASDLNSIGSMYANG